MASLSPSPYAGGMSPTGSVFAHAYDAPLSPLEYPRGAGRGASGASGASQMTTTIIIVALVLALVAALVVAAVMMTKKAGHGGGGGGGGGSRLGGTAAAAATDVWLASDVRGRVVELDEARATKLLEGGRACGPAMLLVYSTTCPACKAIQAPFADAAGQESGVWFGRINALAAQALMGAKNIRNIPTVFGVRADGKVVAPLVGNRDQATLCEFARKLADNTA